jgi:hypothetical protein
MSVHHDRGAWVVRWRQDDRQRSRRFATEPEALAFEEGLSGRSGKPRSSKSTSSERSTSASLMRIPEAMRSCPSGLYTGAQASS